MALSRVGRAPCSIPALGFIVFTGCMGSDPLMTPPPPPCLCLGVTVQPGEATIGIGDTIRIHVVQVSGLRDKYRTWASADSIVAGVDTGGLVTGLRSGTVVIVVTIHDGDLAAEGAATVHVQ